MKSRGTLILVAVFVALAAYVWFVENPKTSDQISQTLGTPTAATQPYVLQLKTTEVKSFQIRDLRKAREVTLTRTETGWHIMPLDKDADASKIEQAIGFIGSLQATRVINNVAAGKINDYGFGAADVEIRVVMSDGTPYAITVGDKTSDGNSYYVTYTGATDKVFLVGTYVIEGARVLFDAPPLITPTAVPPTPAPATTDATPTPKP